MSDLCGVDKGVSLLPRGGALLLAFPGHKYAKMKVTWLILPVVICLSQRLSHALNILGGA